MKQAYKSGASNAAPAASQAASEGFATEGNIAQAIPATVPGPFAFHALFTEIENVIIRGGGVPATADLTQLRVAILAIINELIAAIVFPDGVALATNNQHLQNNPPSNLAATPSGVRAVRDALLNSAPGALDTLDELAAALGDDANFSATVLNALAARYTKTESDARYARRGTELFYSAAGQLISGEEATPTEIDLSESIANFDFIQVLVTAESIAIDRS